MIFNIINGSLIGGWLGGYGSTSSVSAWQILLGSVIWAAGFCGNIYHEEILRDIRRDRPVDKDAEREGRAVEVEVVVDNGRVYRVPEGGLFRLIWHPHVGPNPGGLVESRIAESLGEQYFSEWVEWTGYTIAGGGFYNFYPAAMFVVNEIATMLPRFVFCAVEEYEHESELALIDVSSRALQGKRWYQKKFENVVPSRKAVIPGLI